MEATAQTPADLISLAKQAILSGDKARARQLASSALESEPENLNAMLIMAGVSDPQASLNYLNRVLAVDPNNQVAREGMKWASQRLRKATSAAWKPETIASVKPSTQVKPQPVLAVPRQKGAFATVMPWLLAAIAILGYGLWSTGILDPDPNSVGRTNALAMFNSLIQGKAAPIEDQTQSPTKTTRPTQAIVVPPVSKPSETTTEAPTETATDVPSPTATSTSTRTNTPTLILTSTSTSTLTSTRTNTAVPPTPTVADTTPTQEFDPTSGLPIIQITPLVYLTEEPDPAEYVEPTIDEDPIEYVSEPALPVYTEPLGEKWIDVNLSEQMVYAYEGNTIVGAFLVSTGMADTPTVTGHYYVYVQIPYAHMKGPGYDLADVPYTMYFYKGYGIHGTYWHSNFGTPMSHGCVNMETGEAGWLYDWAFVGIPVSVHY